MMKLSLCRLVWIFLVMREVDVVVGGDEEEVTGLKPTMNPMDVLVDGESLVLYFNGTEYFIKGVAYNPVPIGYRFVVDQNYGGMASDTTVGFGGLCKVMQSPEVTADGKGNFVSVCYDSDYAKSLVCMNDECLYSLPPQGNWFEPLWRRDFPLMKKMGINSIRFYNINPRNIKSCSMIPNYCNHSALIPDHRPMFEVARQYGLTVMWPLPTQSPEALDCLHPPEDLSTLEGISVDDQVQSKECQRYWLILRGMIDEVVNEPNLLMWCYGNEDLPAAWLKDGHSKGNMTERGLIRIERANRFIWMIRNYTIFEYGRRIPVTHATFGSASVSTINLIQYMDTDVFGSNPYGLAILANSYALPNSGGPYAKKWPTIEKVPKHFAPKIISEWPGQVYLNNLYKKPFVATEWGNQPPRGGTVCEDVNCTTTCNPSVNQTTMGLTPCQEKAFDSYGYQFGPPGPNNPSQGAWVAQFYQALVEGAIENGGTIGGYFFEWTDEYYSKRDDWSQRGLGLYHPVLTTDDICHGGSNGTSLGDGYAADKLVINEAGKVASEGYVANGLNYSREIFPADIFTLLNRSQRALKGQPRLGSWAAFDSTTNTDDELALPSSKWKWGISNSCFKMEASATCLASMNLTQFDDLEKYCLASGSAPASIDCSPIDRTKDGEYATCTLLQRATFILDSLYNKSSNCLTEMAFVCEDPPCRGDINTTCCSPIKLHRDSIAVVHNPYLAVVLTVASIGSIIVIGIIFSSIIYCVRRRKQGSRDERHPLLS